MMLILTIAISIYLVQSITLNLNDICHCSQLIQEFECQNSALECIWDYKSKECQDNACSNILFQSLCLQQSWRCYWDKGQCKNFTSCSNIQGQNQTQCQSQNIYCPSSNGTNCQSVEYLQTCSSISNANNCNNYFSSAGLCMWNGYYCIVATSCSQLYINQTSLCDFSGCSFNYITNLCQPKLCSQYFNELSCAQGIQTFGPYLNNVIGCYWNFQTNSCEEFNPQQMNYLSCYTDSAGTFHWSSKNEKKGGCVSCFQQLLILSIIIMFVIL